MASYAGGAVIAGEEDEDGVRSGDESGGDEPSPSRSAGRPPLPPRASCGADLPSASASGGSPSITRDNSSRSMLLLQEAESPAETGTDRDDSPPPRVEMRQLRLTQNQIRLTTRLDIFEREMLGKTQESHEAAEVAIKNTAGALQRTAQAVQTTKRTLDQALDDLLKAASEYGVGRIR